MRKLFTPTFITLLILCAGPLASRSVGQARFSTLYTFPQDNAGGLTYSNGVFYGTTNAPPGPSGSTNCGTVFELRPPAGSGTGWTETVLYNFAGGTTDLCDPLTPPVVGLGGVLYGIDPGGGEYAQGGAYELQPPTSPGGAWTETLIYSFAPISGPSNPFEGAPTALLLGPNGSLYVTTSDGGTGSGALIQLLPPSVPGGVWTPVLLYSFPGGASASQPNSLIAGPNGVFYSTTELGGAFPQSAGTVFELTPPSSPGGVWTGTTLYAFQAGADGADPNGVILGPNGSLYGTTGGKVPVGGLGTGTVFQLTPPSSPGGTWTKTTLATVETKDVNCGPDSPLILHNGNLFGTSCLPGGGEVFELQPPGMSGGAWTLVKLHRFTNSQIPNGALVMTSNGTLYGGTALPNYDPPGGTIYQIRTK